MSEREVARTELWGWLRDEIHEARQSDPDAGISGVESDEALANVLATSMTDNPGDWINLLRRTPTSEGEPTYTAAEMKRATGAAYMDGVEASFTRPTSEGGEREALERFDWRDFMGEILHGDLYLCGPDLERLDDDAVREVFEHYRAALTGGGQGTLATRREDGRGDSPHSGTAPDKVRSPAPSPTGGERGALVERLTRLADSGTQGGGLALANHEVETLRYAVTALRDTPCDCWREAMNMYRHGRDWRLACSCLDHPEEKRCDCPFCALTGGPEPATERDPDWERCDRCGIHYPEVYWADDDQWEEIVGDTFAGLRCLACFCEEAQARGLTPRFEILKPSLARVHIPEEPSQHIGAPDPTAEPATRSLLADLERFGQHHDDCYWINQEDWSDGCNCGWVRAIESHGLDRDPYTPPPPLEARIAEREPATHREPEPEWFRFEGVVERELGTDGGVWVFRADDDPTEEENEAVLEIRAAPHIVQPPTEGENDG